MRLINNTIKSLVKNGTLLAIVAGALMIVGGGTAVAGHLITGKQVKNSSLTGVDIKNKSINAGDLTDKARAALKGNTGATGATGAPGSYAPMATAFSSVQSSTSETSAQPVFTDIPVNVPEGSSKLLIHFNAECAVSDPATYVTQYISIRVDGNTVQNTAPLCANSPDYDMNRWSSNSVQRFIEVTPGAHTVSVLHWVNAGTGTALLDDKTLTVVPAA